MPLTVISVDVPAEEMVCLTKYGELSPGVCAFTEAHNSRITNELKNTFFMEIYIRISVISEISQY
jgi:hypothetical protein